MEKIRNSDLLKIICYILIPILFVIFFFGIINNIYLNEMGIPENITKYSQTQEFANNYLNYFMSKVLECKHYDRYNNFTELQDEKGTIYYYQNNEAYYNYSSKSMENFIRYIIVDKNSGKIYTNIKSNDYLQEMNNIKSNEVYWNYTENKIDTSISYISQYNINYNYNYKYYLNVSGQIEANNASEENIQSYLKDYDIYSFYNDESVKYYGLTRLNVINFMLQNRELAMYLSIISFIILLIIVIYLFWSIGHKKGKEITLGVVDKIPYEIVCISGFTIMIAVFEILLRCINYYYSKYVALTIGIVAYLIGYIVCCVFMVTTIKRIKANKFWESFLCYRIIRYFYREIKEFIHEISNKNNLTKKVFWYYWGYVLISIFLGYFFRLGITTIILFGFWIWVYYKIRKFVRCQNEVKDKLKQIYEGNTDVHIDEGQLEGVLKQMAIYINDISNGFTNSIEQSLKSERLKTELITNVSHDIKTPLTSIINYVDLLKKENIADRKVKEYINIIDEKSQRLKKLTEDVIDASKASSGNIKLNIEEISLKELINQAVGEFKDKFEEKALKVEVDMPEDKEVVINADSRYMYRIIDNLFNNISKYAQENSRVYIDVKKDENVEISIKNISKEKLNISSEELMQRFVRGDKSRYTEGSGLGLSIAKSLTELQKGKFDIIIDGDLFKVVMKW